MENAKSKWDGLGAVVVARQSDDKDGTASTAAQLDLLLKEFERVGLRYVDKVMLDGVSAASPARISAILEDLFARKKKHNDFEVIAWQIEDRASRGGGEHGLWLEHECKRRGIRVYFSGSDQPTGPYASVVKVAKYEAAKEVSVNGGRRSTQMQTWAQKQGFFRTAGPTPLGCDRIYYGADDRPKYIIHNCINGLQEQYDYETRKMIGEYGTIGKKSHNRFKKQRNEYSLLFPGERQYRRVVRVIVYLRYKRGWRACRIADYLNRNGVKSPKGKEWSQRQVQIIYENEAYTGVTFNNQTFSGRFFRRDPVLGFVALERDEIDLVVKKSFSPKLRSMDDWERIDQPHMYDFLPRDVRDYAIEAQAQMWKERSDPMRPPRKINAHPASDYLLSGKLRAVQDGELLRGTLSGDSCNFAEYYRHPRSKRGRRKGSIFNNMIRADVLHEAIVALLADVLIDAPDLRDRLVHHLHEQRAAALQDEPNVAELEAERDELKEQIETTVLTLKGAALADARVQLQRLGDRRNAIEGMLAAIRRKHQSDERPIETVVDEALQLLAEGGRRLLTLPIQPLRDLVDRLIADATVDMETKLVEVKVALPTWALQPKPRKKPEKNHENGQKPALEATRALCPVTTSRSPTGGWTHEVFAIVKCRYEWKRGSTTQPPCYLCRRVAA